jgi:hypothetical protein
LRFQNAGDALPDRILSAGFPAASGSLSNLL